jgi:hypothetical protein
VSENAEDGAQWICTYLGKRYEDAFRTAATQLGFPSVVQMDPYGVIAVFDDANVTITQMKTIKQYLRHCLGNRVFIPDYKVRAEFTKELVMPEYGSYSYLSENAKEEKKLPEQIDHWSYDPALQLCSEVETLINQRGARHGLTHYPTACGVGWNVIVGADHGLGAWRCHTKIMNHSAEYQRHFQDQTKHEKRRSHSESGYHTCQSANVMCKKDAPAVLEETVARTLNAGWKIIKDSQLVVLWNTKKECAVAKMVLKIWGTVTLTALDGLTQLASEDGKETLKLGVAFNDCHITLCIPQVTLLVVGDLAFFAHALGKHGTCGWWCLYCHLKHPEWQTCDHTSPGELWTKEAMEHFRAKVFEEKEEKARRSADPTDKRQKKKKMTADERKGIISHPILPSNDIHLA